MTFTSSTSISTADVSATTTTTTTPSATQELFAFLHNTPASNNKDSSTFSKNGSSAQPMQNYHANLQSLRDSGDRSFLFFRCILEITGNDESLYSLTQQDPQSAELLFHCILGFRHVILHRWSQFSTRFRNASRDFFFYLGLGLLRRSEGQNHAIMDLRLPAMIARVCLATSAALWKRSWKSSYPRKDDAVIQQGKEGGNLPAQFGAEDVDQSIGAADVEKELHYLLQMLASHPVWLTAVTVIDNNGYDNWSEQNVETLFEFCHETVMHPLKLIMNSSTANIQQQQQQRAILNMAVMTCIFLSSLVGEFGGSNSAITYNCPLEFHRMSHVIFEQEGISKVLNIAMGGLSGIVNHWSNNQVVLDASLELAVGVVDVIVDVLGWEFGSIGGGNWGRTGGSGLVRPPESWREYLIRPDLLGAVFQVCTSMRELGRNEQEQVTMTVLRRFQHSLRQLLIGLASITGSIFQSKAEKGAYVEYFVNGLLSVLSMIVSDLSPFAVHQEERSSAQDILLEELQRETVDFCCMLTRIVTNFRVEALSLLHNFSTFLSAISSVGDILLRISVAELKGAHGDVEAMADGGDWRNEAIGQLLEAVCLLSEDHWLLCARPGNAQDMARHALASSLAPLYSSYVSCRIEMAKMEEYYLTANAADLDEVREEISGASMDEEMNAASSVGRVHLPSSLSCLSSAFQSCVPKLQALFASDGQAVTPDAAALLEETRLLILCTGHLLTDDCAGETPFIPEAVLNSCIKPSDSPQTFKTGSDEFVATTHAISQIVHLLMGLAEFQVSKVALSPNNPNLSPLLAKTLLWFFTRWSSAYILPSSNPSSVSELESGQNGILATWSNQEMSRQVVSFCVTLCLHYFTLWPHESQVIQGSSELLLSLAKRDRNVKMLLMSCPSMEHLFNLHICTAGQIHSSLEKKSVSGISEEMVSAYKRIPYKFRANILTAILTSSSEINHEKSEACFNGCLEAVQNSFHTLVDALEHKKVRTHDVFTLEMACLCVELFGGIARASEICHPERIPIFMTPFLPQLSGLMNFYATDITICELLLVLFRDYTERFIVSLDREQCMTVFRASADLLKSYSSNHCKSRVIRKAVNDSHENDVQEEQSYNDVLCAIQLLNNIGAKDFVDSFSSERTGSKGVDSNEVIEVVFYGLQQILPLMTNGLLHFPTLCKQYFSLLGFMMDTYPDKVGMLPFDLFSGLLNSMLFGMSHTDLSVSKSSLQGIAALCREQIENKSLNSHLAHNPSIFDECSRRILEEVIFQTIIWDRIEPAANALLPLAAVDMNRFATVVNTISQQLDTEKKAKIQEAFQKLMDPDVIGKVSKGNYGGRLNRMRFRKDFELFVKDIHSKVLVF